jgi:hypothetical protein
MSKAKLTAVKGAGRYVGSKMKDVLTKLKRNKAARKQKVRFEKAHGHKVNQSTAKPFQNVSSSGSNSKSAIIPVRSQSQKGSSFKIHKVRGTGSNSLRGMGSGRQIGSSGSAESWRADMEKLTTMPTQIQIERMLYKKRKALGGMLKLKRGGDNMPARNKKNFRPTEKGAGMTRAGVAAYRRANPGSKLKTAVTGKVKPGSKAANRRKSYCARSLGQLKRASAKTRNDPNSRIRQARRRWKC